MSFDDPAFRAHAAATLPKRVIFSETGPYLTRYTVRELPDGGHVYLHHFHQSDRGVELHNHPWGGRSIILEGGYLEQRLIAHGVVRERLFRPGDVNDIASDTFHRVELLDLAVGCWSLFTTGPRVQTWGFQDRRTGNFTPWRKALLARGITPSREGD